MKKGIEGQDIWRWEDTMVEFVKIFKYLDYIFQRNNATTAHIKDLIKRVNIAMAQIWCLTENVKT